MPLEETLCILQSMSRPRRFRVLLNPKSGDGGRTPEEIRELFTRSGCECEVTAVTNVPNLKALAASDEIEMIWVAAGGDGTINAVAEMVANTGRIMAVLPCGTLNHFAQDLNIPTNLEQAIELAANGRARPVDAGEVNGRIFVNNSSLGFYPAMVADRERMKKRGLNKWWSLAVASLRAFMRLPCVRVTVDVNGRPLECRTALLFVGNNEYDLQGGNAGRRKHMDSGVLSLCMVPNASRAGLLRLFAAALAGRTPPSEEVECQRATHFVVSCHKRHLRVSFDGEISRMRVPLRYRTRPGALRVIAPDEEAE